MSLRNFINLRLDRLARKAIQIQRPSWNAFRLCGCAGLVCAVMLATGLSSHLGLRPWVVALLVPSSVLAFLSLAIVTKIIAGEERLVYYHQEVMVITSAAFVLWALRQPVLPYLDVTALCVGMFLSCGRVGCLLVGCCHGRPHRWGVRYGAEHARDGFTRHYVGVRLFPVQAVESLWALCVVVAGSLMVLSGRPAGSALAWYVVVYDAGRFGFEFMRGDPGRPYRAGFSEAQWTAVGLTALVAGAELYGVLPLQLWHVGAAACLAIAMIVVATIRSYRRTPGHKLLHPRHVKELAEAISCFDEATHHGRTPIQVRRTSLGVLISASNGDGQANGVRHYSLSFQKEVMDERAAETLAKLICRLKQCPAPVALIEGRQAVFHLLI